MDLIEYRKDLIEDVKATAISNEDGSTSSFVQIVSEKLIEIEVIPEFYPSYYSGTTKRGKRMRVDGYVLDEVDLTMYLFIADYSGQNVEETLIKSEALKHFERVSTFVSEAINGNLKQHIEISTAAFDLVDLLERRNDHIRKFKFILLTDSLASERIQDLPNGEVNQWPVEYHIWDLKRLYRVLSSEQGVENNEIDFTEFTSSGLPCIEAKNENAANYRSFLCIIPGIVLANIYDKFGSKLLEGNVRSFLSTKVAVNKKIRQTIIAEPEMFFAYNNGVSATASEVVVEISDDGKYLKYAKDFQIVNGGQTTASLASAKHKDKVSLDNIFVQMKLTRVNDSESITIIPNIARSSNSQNKISEADFFSNHQFHIRMEQISRRIFAPAVEGAQHEKHWFYERARGQYLQQQMKMTKTEKKKFELQNPKNQVITKTDLAKYRSSWSGIPHIVSKGSQTQFVHFANIITDQWEQSDVTFNEDFYKDTIALGILFKHTENLVSKQPWYENGYRANIVTYSIALLSHLISKYFPDKNLNLSLIWNKQKIPDVLTRQMTIISKTVFDHITDPSREIMNVTQWCKREKCWKGLKTLSISLNPELESLLLKKDEKKEINEEAINDQKLINGFEAQMFVLNLGAQYWNDLKEWGALQKLLSVEEIKLLNTIISLIRRSKLPNAYQSQRIQKIRNKMILEGWSEPAKSIHRN